MQGVNWTGIINELIVKGGEQVDGYYQYIVSAIVIPEGEQQEYIVSFRMETRTKLTGKISDFLPQFRRILGEAWGVRYGKMHYMH